MRYAILVLILIAGCHETAAPPTALEVEKSEVSTSTQTNEQEQAVAAAIERDREIREEQERIDRIRRANELDMMERAAQQNKALSDPSFVPKCDSELDIANLRRLKLVPYSRDTRMCVPEGGEASGVSHMTRCPPCR